MYRSCDVLGRAATELSPKSYRAWGRVLGCRVEPGAKFVVGGDVRTSTRGFLAALVEGLCEAGVDVVNLGILPTPMIRHARRRLRAAACAIVTASHHPADFNGLQWMIGDMPPSPRDVEALRRGAEGPFDTNGDRRPTTPRALDVSCDYVAGLQETFVDAAAAPCHAVLDPMHGCWAGRVRQYLNAVFPQGLFTAIHDGADGRFGGSAPDCAAPQNLEELCEAVYRERAPLGIAFDGNGARAALIDGDGVPLGPDETAWVLLQSFPSELEGAKFVHDVRFSDRVAEAAAALGAEPLVTGSGYACVRRRMAETGARFGAETTGHYFYGELDGDDDALLSACRVIALLARSGKTLAELRRDGPEVFITPDLPLDMPSERHGEWLDRVRKVWADFPQRELDGLRIDTPAGWALVRSSPGESALTFRFESVDWHGLSALVGRFCDTLPEGGERLWARYHAAMDMPAPRGY
jgi:phosphomannomutase